MNLSYFERLGSYPRNNSFSFLYFCVVSLKEHWHAIRDTKFFHPAWLKNTEES